MLESRQVHQGERPRDPSREIVSLDAERLEAEGDVRADVQMGKEGIVLEDHSEAPGHRLEPGDVLTFHQYPSCIGSLESGQEPKRGGLTAAARTEQRQHLPPLERKGKLIHRYGTVEALRERFQAEKGHRVSPLPFPGPPYMLVPVAHPAGPVLGEKIPIHVGDDHLALHFRHPERNRIRGQVATGRQTEHLAGREQLGLLAPDVVDEGARRLGVPAPRTSPMASSITTVPLEGKT